MDDMTTINLSPSASRTASLTSTPFSAAAPGGSRGPNVIRQNWFRPRSPELLRAVRAADELAFPFTLHNRRYADGSVEVDIAVYAGRLDVEVQHLDLWWERPAGWGATDRVLDESDGWTRHLTDPRWLTHACRAVMLTLFDSYVANGDGERHVYERFPAFVIDFSDSDIPA